MQFILWKHYLVMYDMKSVEDQLLIILDIVKYNKNL